MSPETRQKYFVKNIQLFPYVPLEAFEAEQTMSSKRIQPTRKILEPLAPKVSATSENLYYPEEVKLYNFVFVPYRTSKSGDKKELNITSSICCPSNKQHPIALLDRESTKLMLGLKETHWLSFTHLLSRQTKYIYRGRTPCSNEGDCITSMLDTIPRIPKYVLEFYNGSHARFVEKDVNTAEPLFDITATIDPYVLARCAAHRQSW